MKYTIIHLLDDLGLVWKYALNGLIGGLIWSMYKKSKFWESFRQIIIGGIVSGYFTPVIVAKSSMDMSLVGFTSFVIGMLGMVIVDSIYKYAVKLIKKWKEAIIIINQKQK
jgi:LytS/YehU family sensor histidine kinase